MSALLESMSAEFEALPAARVDALGLGAPRRAALAAALADGLPGPRSEAWKYTSLRALSARRFSPAAAATVDPALLADIPSPRLVLVNGHFDPTLSRLDGLPDGVELERRDADGRGPAHRGEALGDDEPGPAHGEELLGGFELDPAHRSAACASTSANTTPVSYCSITWIARSAELAKRT